MEVVDMKLKTEFHNELVTIEARANEANRLICIFEILTSLF